MSTKSHPTTSRRLRLPALLLALLLCVVTSTRLRAADYEEARRYHILFNEAMLQRQKGNHDAVFSLLYRCLQLRPDASEAYFYIAQYYDEMRQDSLALRSYQMADSLCPGNKTYMAVLADQYLGTGRYAEATDVIERMYEADKGQQELLETLYRLYLQQRDYTKAIGVLERMELIDGKSERISLAKSNIYVQMGDNDRAIEEMHQLAAQHPNDLGYRILYANTLLMGDRNDEALGIIDNVLAGEPDNVKAQMALRNYYQLKSETEAADSMTRVLLLNPRATSEEKVYQLRQIIANNEAQLGDSTEVLRLFSDILAQPSPDPDIAEMRAAYMDLKKMPADSVNAAFEYVLALAPDRASARMRLVQLAWDNDDNQRIISLCQGGRQYNPEELTFYYLQGMAYYQQGDSDGAYEALRNGINVISDDSSPSLVSDFYAIMGDLLHQKGRQAEAYAAYDSCLQWKPDNYSCLNNYAYFLSLDGQRLDEAEQMSYRAVRAEPHNATFLDTYAWILFREQRYAEARIYIDQALQNDDDAGAVVLEHAGDIYALGGDTDGAVTLWQRALAKDPANRLLAKKIKRKKYIAK